MKIYEVDIPDISSDTNGLYSKLGREIEKCLSPIFLEQYLKDQEEVLMFRKALDTSKLKLKEEKNKCQNLSQNYERQKIIRHLLSKVYKIINFGLVSKDKREDIILLLRGLDNLETNLIQKHSEELGKIIETNTKSSIL
jgi:hypothetical protein